MSDHTKQLLRTFFERLRDVNPKEIYGLIDGLTQFDREEIRSEKNNILAMDKLVEAVGKRNTRTFVSFVNALRKHGHEDIANDIVAEAKCRNFQNLYRALVPIAAISPSTHLNNKEKLLNNDLHIGDNIREQEVSN